MVLDGFPLFELCHWTKMLCSTLLGLPCLTDELRAQKNVYTKPIQVDPMMRERP